MSFALKSIELNNIRAHEHFLFEPALEGITAISGENGAGKSTLVDAFAWALYGTRPSGVRNKHLIKDGVDPKDKPVSVKSIILSGGIEYAIERKIITEQGAIECNVWGKNKDSDEFKHVAGPGVSHVEKFIRNELGMNEKGFLTSVLIQQKQVDQIVSASPRERGAVIEELTGIASITQAIQKTNENTRALEKAASIFKVGNLEEVEQKVERQEKVHKDIVEKESQAINKFNNLKFEYKESKEELDIQDIKVKKRIELSNKIDNINKQIDFLKKQSKDDLKYILDYKSKYGTTIYTDSLTNKKAVESKRKESYKIKTDFEYMNKSLSETKINMNNCKILKGQFKDEAEAKKELTKLNNKLIKTSKDLEVSLNKESMLSSEIKHSKASHEYIDGEDTKCPICKSKIKDPEALRNEMQIEINNFKLELKETKIESKKLETKKEELISDIKEIGISIEAIKEENVLIEDIKVKTKELKKISSEINLIDVDLKVLEEEYDKVLRIEADKAALDSAKERSLTVNTTIANNEEDVKTTLEEISKLNALTDRSFNALSNKTTDLQDKLTKMSIAGKELRGRKLLELERLGDYKKNLKDVQDAMERYDEIAEQIEVSSAASTMLAAFKADRIESSIPTLEFFASDFLAKFTGGAFTKLTIDDKFNAFVTTIDDVIRPVAQLSGGELSSTAIALRLGIAMLLNSSEKNVLILDEVLVSMDEDRSRQIMETIGSMTNSQVIFIAHNNDINSVADKTVLVSKKQ